MFCWAWPTSAIRCLPCPSRPRCAAEALDEVGLLDRATAWASRLSGGERQRVGLARALVRRPGLLLGDEPFASADPTLVRHLSDELRDAVARSGLTVIIVPHQIDTALALADRAFLNTLRSIPGVVWGVIFVGGRVRALFLTRE